MRIAVLVLAHTNQRQLGALVERLAPDFDVYVHIDKRSALEPAVLTGIPGVTVMRRHRVHWGSVSIADATLTLLRAAAAGRYDRYVVISGQDVPIRSNADIAEFFAAYPDVDFINSLPLADWSDAAVRRVTRLHFLDPRGATGPRRILLHAGEMLSHRLNLWLRVDRPWDWDFRGGANWFDLTGDTVDTLVRFLDRNPQFRRRFRLTRNSSEIFFQTALVAAGCQRPTQPVRRYIDWSSGGNNPKTLDLTDLSKVVASDALFARKCDERVEPELVRSLLSLTSSAPVTVVESDGRTR